jgi:hypothetical protein
MKTPRVTDFDPNAKKEPALKSSLDNMPAIEKPSEKQPNASVPASQKSGKPANKKSSMPEIQHAGKPEIPQNLIATEKVTYRFHPEGKYAIEDIKTILARKLGIKASCELIAEEAILIAYEDLLANQHASELAKRLSSKPASQKSS